MSALTLPGDIPGLLRRGSPVRLVRCGVGGSGEPWACMVWRFSCGGWRIAWDDGGFGFEDPVSPGWVANHALLDLEDATGRAHAAWWLAGRLDLRAPFGALWQRAEWKGCWRVVLPHTDGIAIHPHDWAPEWEAITAHLDPNGPRLLADGSRWVDAEALRLVCLHVAGLS